MLRHVIASGENQLMGDPWISKTPMKVAISIGPGSVAFWRTPVLFSTAFHVKRATASSPKAELLEPLTSVLRMHPNGQNLSLILYPLQGLLLTTLCFPLVN